MKMTSKITINKPAADVWRVLADEFIALDAWMAAITHTEEKTEGKKVPGAPTIGRKAYIGFVPGSYMDVTITMYDQKSMKIGVHTTIENGKSAPVKGFDYVVSVTDIGNSQSEVTWDAKGNITPLGYFLYPVIKKNLNAGFFRGLEELKCFVETGLPHQRARDNMAKWKKEGVIS